jgi:hypothetical protein
MLAATNDLSGRLSSDEQVRAGTALEGAMSQEEKFRVLKICKATFERRSSTDFCCKRLVLLQHISVRARSLSYCV